MRALFDDAAIFQNYNYVSRFNSRQPMRNNQRGSACHNLHQRSLNMLLRFVIQSRGRFVHNQNRRIFEKRPRNRYALPLPTRQQNTIVPNDGIEPLRHSVDKLISMSTLDR